MKTSAIAQIDYSSIKAVTLRFKPGEDLKSSIETFVTENKIKAACILSAVGSLKQAAIRYADQ